MDLSAEQCQTAAAVIPVFMLGLLAELRFGYFTFYRAIMPKTFASIYGIIFTLLWAAFTAAFLRADEGTNSVVGGLIIYATSLGSGGALVGALTWIFRLEDRVNLHHQQGENRRDD